MKIANKSCENASKYVNQAIKNAPKFEGHGPINHLNSIKVKILMKNVVLVGSQ